MEVLKGREDILKLIREVLAKKQILEYEITEVIPNEKGEGYLGDVFRITITHEGQELKLIVKAAFTDEKVRKTFSIRQAFQNEIMFYNELYPLYVEINPEICNFIPECYGTSLEEQKELLILQNIHPNGYGCFNKKRILDSDHMALIFEIYGKFHGYSAVMKHQKPTEFQEFAKRFVNIFAGFVSDSGYEKHLDFVNGLAKGALILGQDDEVIKAFEKHSGSKIVKSMTRTATEVDEFSLILHGDCWSNNMMFKYEGQKPKQITLIDFQLMRLGSPVCDLSYFFFSGGSKADLDRLDHYLRLYHASFSVFVRKCGEDPDELFPFSVLKEHWRKYAMFGYCMSLDVIKLKLTNKEDVVDLKHAAVSENFVRDMEQAKFNQVEYQRRVRDLILHLYEVGAL